MGTSLNGLTPAGTYPGLIKTGDNAPIDGTLKTLSDGNGNNLPMAVSTTAVNFTNQLQQSGVAVPTASQVAAKQDTLVSGTNIKTINGTSVLGPGNIAVVTSPSGVAGAIQFSNGSAFASDAANFFWDDTNNRLGVGTNAPSFPVDVAGEIRSTTQVSAGTTGTNGTFLLRRTTDGATIGSFSTSGNEILITEFSGSGGRLVTGFGTTALKWIGSSSQPRIGVGFNGSILATTHIQGSGSTSATTSLLVQNSGGETKFSVDDSSVGTGVMIGNLINGYSSLQWPANNVGMGLTSGGGIGIKAFCLVIGDTTTLANIDSAKLVLNSTTQGFLPPRMTTTQKTNISSPAEGLVVYDTTLGKLCVRTASAWETITSV